MSDEEQFYRELKSGHDFAEKVGERLRASGRRVEVTELVFRESVDQVPEYHDELDIVVGESDGPKFVVESKSRRLRFSEDPASYPYTTAFVDTKSGWDGKITKPKAVVLVSTITDAMLVISVRRTRHLWCAEQKYDHVRRIRDHWYLVPAVRLVPMDSLVEWLARDDWLTQTD